MKQGDKKLFLDRDKLTQMINLRRNGLTVTTLAIMFGCDYSSIRAQCDKYGIVPRVDVIYGIERIIAQIIPHYIQSKTFKVVNGEKINLGKSYAEYVTESLAKSKYPYSYSYQNY